MREQVFKLKKLVYEMESYLYKNNKDKVFRLAEEVNEASKKLMLEITNNSTDSSEINKGYNEEINEAIPDSILKIDELEYLSTINFLYKPVTKQNYYEGDYLEKFSTQRTDELKRANVIEIHNRFWAINEIEKGNIFGSIPKELIDEDSRRLLLRYGWKEANVNIYKFLANSRSKVIKLCENEFKKHLIIREKKNGEYFVLDYKEDNN